MDDFDYRVTWARYVAHFTPGKTQSQVGDLAGVDQSTVGRWLRAASEPKHSAAIRFARSVGRNPLEALVAAGLLSLSEAERGISQREIDFLVDLQDDGPDVELILSDASNAETTVRTLPKLPRNRSEIAGVDDEAARD